MKKSTYEVGGEHFLTKLVVDVMLVIEYMNNARNITITSRTDNIEYDWIIDIHQFLVGICDVYVLMVSIAEDGFV